MRGESERERGKAYVRQWLPCGLCASNRPRHFPQDPTWAAPLCQTVFRWFQTTVFCKVVNLRRNNTVRQYWINMTSIWFASHLLICIYSSSILTFANNLDVCCFSLGILYVNSNIKLKFLCVIKTMCIYCILIATNL